MGEVKVYRAWGSPFSMRVEVALKMKGVKYEYVEEDLLNKSDELLQYNPIHKKIPVMVVDGKPIAESLVIMEYIDETWKGDPHILPSHPYDRARARFWSKFVDDKLLPQLKPAFMSNDGEQSTKAIKELDDLLTILENEIKGKKFFGGNNIGFVDIVASVVVIWIPCWQAVTGKEVLTREKFPSIYSWADELLECSVIKQNMPDQEKLQAFYRDHFALMNAKTTD
ncbi:probable glutathione S-transferase [Chenopodium quinoa]|uniref:glutathione transferase n=1 Tax=Chenopodium quinoa TaxID=63459 RepID=A0A803MRL7_CHEQI|nr:probable glutathione S-transferase [Chenopodium quinoa]